MGCNCRANMRHGNLVVDSQTWQIRNKVPTPTHARSGVEWARMASRARHPSSVGGAFFIRCAICCTHAATSDGGVA